MMEEKGISLSDKASAASMHSPDQKALLDAAQKDDAATAQGIIKRCDNLNTSYKPGETALWLFAQSSNADMVVLLMEKKANPATQDSDGKSGLHWAAQHGNEAMCQALLDAQVDPDQATIEKGWTALHMSCVHQQPALCQQLLEAKADADIVTNKNADSETGLRNALHLAAVAGSQELCQMLMKKGDQWQERDWYPADDGKQDEAGKTPMEVAKGGELQEWMKSESEQRDVCWFVLEVSIDCPLCCLCCYMNTFLKFNYRSTYNLLLDAGCLFLRYE